MAEQFGFERLMALCTSLEAQATPEMIHGLLSGHLCAGGRMMAEQYIAQMLEQMESKKVPDAEAKSELVAFYDSTLAVLQDEQMLFQPIILPAGNELSQRMVSLASWCSAFISGFGLSGRNLSAISAEANEIIADMAEISLLQEDDASDSVEEDWITVFEHVRLSAVSLFLEFNESPAPTADDHTTH